jgi:hypothetical protein
MKDCCFVILIELLIVAEAAYAAVANEGNCSSSRTESVRILTNNNTAVSFDITSPVITFYLL